MPCVELVAPLRRIAQPRWSRLSDARFLTACGWGCAGGCSDDHTTAAGAVEVAAASLGEATRHHVGSGPGRASGRGRQPLPLLSRGVLAQGLLSGGLLSGGLLSGGLLSGGLLSGGLLSGGLLSGGLLVLGLLSVGLATGCSRDRNNGPPSSDARDTAGTTTLTTAGLTTKESAVDRITTARCAREVTCAGVEPDKHFSMGGRCVSELKERLDRELSSSECAVGIDAKQVDECLETIRKESCSNPLSTIERLAECRTSAFCPRTQERPPL